MDEEDKKNWPIDRDPEQPYAHLITYIEMGIIAISIFHIIFGTLQFNILKSMLLSSKAMDAMSIHPIVIIIFMIIPGLVIKFIATMIGIHCIPEGKKGVYREVTAELYHEQSPWLFILPVFQLHLGIIMLVRITWSLLVRFIFQVILGKKPQRKYDRFHDAYCYIMQMTAHEF